MRRFKWIDWNRQKLAAHSLSPAEVEAAFERAVQIDELRDGSFHMSAALPSGRPVTIIWRYDRDEDATPDVFGETEPPEIFVITAY